MRALPTGTITFLFTDIEASTRLLQELGPRYADVLIQQRAFLRAATQGAGGYEVDTQGDAFFAAFQRARDAVGAAIDAQRAITSHPWLSGIAVRIRMGLHTGEPVSYEAGYLGLDVHLAARICAIAHGGQILLSQTTHNLVEDDLPAGVLLRDLGQHRLKDLGRPQRLFQVVVPHLPADFPPLRSLDVLPHNLPIQLTSFVGRIKEIAEAKRLLSTTRLLTLTGSGGCGKTRLALQVAADLVDSFKDGIWFVDLERVTDPALVSQTLAMALGVREESSRSLLTTLIEYLKDKHLMVILDSCEHLLQACAELSYALLRSCSGLQILATSRERLGIAGETTCGVPSLSLPDPRHLLPIEQLADYEAVRLFVERAAAGSPSFNLTPRNANGIARVCYHLDGIPLAVELAAVQVKVLQPDQIADRLEDRFRLLTAGSRVALPRHRTLRATMDWSHDLLEEPERVLLRRLSVFAGGFTLQAAEEICRDEGVGQFEVLDLLARLVDKSLVLTYEAGSAELRYRLLEMIRQYAHEKLDDASESAPIRTRHRDWCLKLAEQAEPEILGPRQKLWLDRLDKEYDNLRDALVWSLSAGESESALRLAGALTWYWFARSHFAEGRRWLDQALSGSVAMPPKVRVKALCGAGTLAWGHGDQEKSAALCEEALAVYRQIGDTLGIAQAASVLGHVSVWRHDNVRAAQLLGEGLTLFQGLKYPWGMGFAADGLGFVSLQEGNYEAAVMLWQESLIRFKEAGYALGIAYAIHSLGIAAQHRADYDRASDLYQESLSLYREVGDKRGAAVVLMRLGDLAWLQRRYQQAREFYEESLALRRDMGDKGGVASSLYSLGIVARDSSDYARAAIFCKESLMLYQELGNISGVTDCLEGFASLAVTTGHPARAARLLGAADNLRSRDVGPSFPAPLSLTYSAEDSARVHRLTREALEEGTFAAAWEEGRVMTLEQAIAYALREEA